MFHKIRRFLTCGIVCSNCIFTICSSNHLYILIDFSLSVKAATLIFISRCGWAISSPKQGKSGFIYNLVKS